jgi:predicted nucleic acid-binding protein
MQSPTGASAALPLAALEGQATLLMSVPLVIEYEASCTLPQHRLAAGLRERECRIFLDGLAALAEPVESHFLWRPQLRDPADEMALEAAVNGRANAIVTFNARDFGGVTARFGIDLLKPAEAVRRVRK